MSGALLNEDGSTKLSTMSKAEPPEEEVWLPPLRIGDFHIRESPFAALQRSGSNRKNRGSVLKPVLGEQIPFQDKVKKLQLRSGLAIAQSRTSEGQGFGRSGALTARQQRAKAPLTPRRPLSSRNTTGALGWLYREPENDEQRMSNWILSNPAPECMLRQALRTPLAASSPRDSVSQTFASSSLSTVANDVCEKHVEHIEALVREVGRYRQQDTPVLQAGRRRVERIKQFVAEELQLMEEASACAAQERALDEEAEDPSVVFTCNGLTLDTSTSSCSRSRGTRGLAKSETGFQKLMQNCKEVITMERPTTPSVASLIVQDAETDEQKAWALFCWLCFHVSYEAAGATRPEAVLRTRQARASGFAQLFADFCAEVGLKAEVVPGHSYSYASEQTEDVCSSEESRHAWNAVELDGQWALVDCTRGAGFCGRGVECVKSFRPYFFGPEHDDLAYTHFPTDPRFQLLACPLEYDQFLAQPQVNPEVFCGLNMNFYPERRSIDALPQFFGGTNAGVVMLRVPRNVRVRASVDGDESLCFCAPVARQTRFRVTVISAKRLHNTDLGGYDLSDPYCKFEVIGKPDLVWQTKVVENSLNPTWNESFEVNECAPGDRLRFVIYDRDVSTKDDALGSYVMSTNQFHSGQDFDGEVDLDGDGALRSKLRLHVEVLSYAARGSKRRNDGQSSVSELVAIHFCTRSQPSHQKIEVQARRANASADLFRRACSWTVGAPVQSQERRAQDFWHPCFPQIQTDVWKKYGLDFFEAWPVGCINLGDQSEVTLRMCAPPSVQITADVDGNRDCTLVQPGPALDNVIEVSAQILGGEHELNICVRPKATDSAFERAASYRIVRRTPTIETLLAGFPETTALFSESRVRLEEPLAAQLRPGLAHFRVILSSEYSELTLRTGGKCEHLHCKQPGARGGRRAAPTARCWSESLIVYEPEATLFCSLRGDTKPLIRWVVTA